MLWTEWFSSILFISFAVIHSLRRIACRSNCDTSIIVLKGGEHDKKTRSVNGQEKQGIISNILYGIHLMITPKD